MFEDEGYRMMSAAFEVYNQLGYGMAEEISQQSLEIELMLRHIPFVSKPELRTFYKGQELSKRYIPDLLVFNGIVVELKAVVEIITDHEAQLFNYMRISRQEVGYILNFGQKTGFNGSDISYPICTSPTRKVNREPQVVPQSKIGLSSRKGRLHENLQISFN
jgi:GxxExxY protein